MSQLWHLLQLWQLSHIYDYFQKAKSAFSEQKNAGMGNTPRVSYWLRILAAWSPRSVNDIDLWFLGSAHGVPNDELCLRWMSMAYRESNSFLQWAHLKPNDMGNLFGPSGFPLPAHLNACCQSTVTSSLTCYKVPPVAHSIPIAPKLALNTIAKEEYAQSVLCA